MALTKKDLQQIVKVLTPKFNRIDERLDQMDNSLAMFATKHDLDTAVEQLHQRLYDLEENLNNFSGDTVAVQIKTEVRFDHLDEKLEEHDEKFQQIISHVGSHSQKFRDHETRIVRLEKTST